MGTPMGWTMFAGMGLVLAGLVAGFSKAGGVLIIALVATAIAPPSIAGTALARLAKRTRLDFAHPTARFRPLTRTPSWTSAIVLLHQPMPDTDLLASGLEASRRPRRDPSRAPAGARTRIASRCLQIALWIGTLGFALSMIRYTLDAQLTVPFSDGWDFVDWYRDALERGVTFAGLWAPHNGHRLLIPRLVFFADDTWFHGDRLVLVVASLLLQAGVIALIVAALMRERRLRGTLLGTGLAAAVTILLTWTVQLENFQWGIQFCYVFPTFLSVAAIVCTAETPTTPGIDYRTVFGVGLVLLACLSFGVGLAAWPALLIVALAHRRRGPVLAMIGGGAVLSALWYVGYAETLSALSHPPDLRDTFLFVCRYFAPPFIRRSYALGIGVGLVACGGLAIALALTRRLSGRLAAVGVGLVTFGFTMAVLTAFSRSEFAYARYSMFSLLYWVGILLLVGLTSMECTRPLRWAFAAILAAGILRFPLTTQAQAAQPFIARTEAATEAALSLAVGTPDQVAIEAHLYPRPEVPIRLTPFLRSHGYSLFATAVVRSLGSPVTRYFQVGSDICPATLEVVSWSGGLRLSGTFTSPATSKWLVLVDDTGIVRGLATKAHHARRWAGYANANGHGGTLYGVRRNRLCRAATMPTSEAESSPVSAESLTRQPGTNVK